MRQFSPEMICRGLLTPSMQRKNGPASGGLDLDEVFD